MTQFASASFTAADGTELSAADANWTQHPSYSGAGAHAKIYGNRCSANTSASPYTGYYHTASPASADYSVSVDLYYAGASAGAFMGPLGRFSTSVNTGYHAQYQQISGAWRLLKIVNGIVTQLGSSVTQTLTVGNTYKLTLSLSGSSVTLLVDDVVKISATDSAISAAGRPGFRGQGANNATQAYLIDNFSADQSATSITLTGANAAGAGTASTGAIVQTHLLAAAHAAGAGTAQTGALTQTHALAASHAAGTGTAQTGALTQAHALAAANAAGAGAASTGAIVLGDVVLLAAAPAAGAGTAGSGAIVQTHLLAAAHAAGSGAATTGRVAQTHLLAALDAAGAGTASTGVIILPGTGLGTITSPTLYRATPALSIRRPFNG